MNFSLSFSWKYDAFLGDFTEVAPLYFHKPNTYLTNTCILCASIFRRIKINIVNAHREDPP